MGDQRNPKRVAVCGAPGAGKKHLLEALATHMGTAVPTVFATTDEMPLQIVWEADFPRGGLARFEALHGPGFSYEDAVVQLLSRPLAFIIYVLSQSDPHFQESWRRLETSSFETYSKVASTFGRTWRDVPWVFIRHRSWQSNPNWMTELVPAALGLQAMTVDSNSGSGVEELSNMIDDVLADPCRSCP